jgi:hypothetical protein
MPLITIFRKIEFAVMGSFRFPFPSSKFFVRGVLLFILLVFFLKVPVAKGETHANAVETLHEAVSVKADAREILLVLEGKIGNHKALEKVKEKLGALDEKQTRLIANLCERVKTSGRTAGADISLLLVSVLVILSTQHDTPEYRKAAFQYGADCFFVKTSLSPIRLGELVKSFCKI